MKKADADCVRDAVGGNDRRPSVVIIGTRGYPSYYGGFETLVRRLAPFMVDQGWDVTVYCRPGSTRPNDPQRDIRVHTVFTPGFNSRSMSTLSFGLTSVLSAIVRKPDVALLMNVANGFWLPLLKARGIPTVVNVDGIEWDRAKWGRMAKAMFRAGAKATALFANTLIYDAQEISRRWKREFGRTGLVIPYGGDLPGDLPIPAGLTRRQYVLLVARFVPENTVAEFFTAAPSLSEVADVVLVGSSGYGGELDERASALASQNPRIHWLGHISDDDELFALWRHAGVYFHGHSVGGTNPALVQAMACGAPTVARGSVYNREVLGPAGKFCDPDPESIRDAIALLLLDQSEQDRLSELSVARASQEYDWKSVCEDYVGALAEHVDVHAIERQR